MVPTNLRTFEEGTQELDQELRLEPAQNPKPTNTAFHQCMLLKKWPILKKSPRVVYLQLTCKV
jgi:hypothetical protein